MHRSFYFLLLTASLAACSAFKPLDEKLVSDDEKTRSKAIQKIDTLSTEKKAALIDRLAERMKDPESRVVNRAVEALGIIGPPAVDAMKTKLTDSDVYVRLSAAATLGQIGPLAHGAVPNLIQALQDPHPAVREEVIFALGQMGPAAAEAAPALLKAFKTSNKDEQESLADTLKKIGVRPPRIS